MTQMETLIVAPTHMAADELARRWCVERGGALGLHRFSLGMLARELASPRLASSGKSVLAGIAVDALAARAVQECRTTTNLQWFEPVATAPGFFRALASTLSELRMNHVQPAALQKVSTAGADLARLIEAYQHYLSEQRLADSAEIYKNASEVAQDSSYLFRGASLVLLDIIPRSKAERDFVESLRTSAADVTEITRVDKGSRALDRLRTYVFSADVPPQGELDSSLEFHSATDEARECVEIARSILFTTGKGILFDKAAILLRNPEAYQPLVEDALRRAGIPAFFTHGARRPNPSGRALLALLACAAEGLTASRFSEYLSLGQVPPPDIEGKPPERDPSWVPVQGELFPETPPAAPDETAAAASEGPAEVRTPQHWERLLVDAAVIGGRDRWVRRLDGLDREFEKRLEELKSEDDPRAAYVERQRDRLQALRKFALPLIDRLDRLPKSAYWQEWLDALERLAATALRHPEAVLSVLAELRPMSNTGPVTLEEVREVLTHRLSFLRMEPTERRYGKVFVATIPEAAGMFFDTVYLPGLGEDLFPKKAFEDPLLLDVDREQVSVDLLVQHTRVAEERRLLQTVAASAEKKLWISYPRPSAVAAVGGRSVAVAARLAFAAQRGYCDR
jgi:ATP-dependent helicase/nuclease subunit B